MAKLPDNFVKPPPVMSRLTAARSIVPKQGRRARKAEDSALDAEAARHVHDVLVQLSPEEHQALLAACDALTAVGETISVDEMIKQIIARWIAATRLMQAPETPAPVAPPPLPARQLRAQLRWLTKQPLQRWSELGQTLRRWSRRLSA